jgi:hypothetical protein
MGKIQIWTRWRPVLLTISLINRRSIVTNSRVAESARSLMTTRTGRVKRPSNTKATTKLKRKCANPGPDDRPSGSSDKLDVTSQQNVIDMDWPARRPLPAWPIFTTSMEEGAVELEADRTKEDGGVTKPAILISRAWHCCNSLLGLDERMPKMARLKTTSLKCLRRGWWAWEEADEE